ncbi:hypothetical protein [Polyangium sorediatum]|uniref:Lipoprotein n=1 Tax=Polyangium sorediatum TaxID=889274 RepID=A0ABT6NUC7_9BACT|nr:hypothetical protein [Polyangium sorediatum]MDI1431747.1 hypothetical protein [Polyangium sorediatum]
MKELSISVLALCLVACGPDWNGTFVGDLSQSGDCSDGSSVPETEETLELTLYDNGDTVAWDAACGATVIADVEGDTARVRQTSCPAETVNGTTRSLTIQDGTLTLTDTSLRVELALTATLSGALTGTCELTAEGRLARLAE